MALDLPDIDVSSGHDKLAFVPGDLHQEPVRVSVLDQRKCFPYYPSPLGPEVFQGMEQLAFLFSFLIR